MAETKKETITKETITEENNVLKLKKPFELDGDMVDSISYDLEGLTGNDIERAITELNKKGIVITMPDFDQRYHTMLFAIASGVSYEDLNRLPAKDYTKMSETVRAFFLE